MQTENQSERLSAVDKVVSGNIVEAGTDHITIRDIAAGVDITVRVDDRTRYVWMQPQHQGRLTDDGQVRVGYYFAGGVHTASEVLVLEPGNGVSIAEQLVPTVH
ncbi:hypothetical protein [Vitiosangium sp. GDMCC 1.1324]|uniref:hypothetical protein n=1 Tax=Vitiosangium sp. (strain GDMCC 1.1324) TaxID=2138576 RepID=UPI0011B37CFA|nr:hypothetical protein [Vitiosangium sp. GDMCC 1.1324]